MWLRLYGLVKSDRASCAFPGLPSWTGLEILVLKGCLLDKWTTQEILYLWWVTCTETKTAAVGLMQVCASSLHPQSLFNTCWCLQDCE